MPLDELARKYAYDLFNQKKKQIYDQEQQELEAVRRQTIRPGVILPGYYVKGVTDYSIKRVRLLAEARAESFLRAYEDAGFPFDDNVAKEITDEVLTFCNNQQHREVGFLADQFQQPVPSQTTDKFRADEIVRLQNGMSRVMDDIIEQLRIRRYKVALDERRTQKVYAAAMGKAWDVFISHASEDKEQFVRLLAEALTKSGLSVWYDETTLKVGDSLRRAIDHGLANSRFGVVILSHKFFAKQWPQNELDGLASREVEGVKVILPVWHNITAAEVSGYSPMLAGRVAAKSSDGLNVVVRQLREAMGLQ